jgi:polyhydroxyalkanoate synthesis regulator phasin
MPMQIESLEVLEKADVAPAQARAIVRAIEIEIAGARDTLATKQDLAPLAQDVGVLKQDVAVLKQDVTAIKHDVAALRQELRHGLEISRKEISELGATLRGELRAEIHASASGVTRQMYVAVLGQMAVLLGFAYFFTTHLR